MKKPTVSVVMPTFNREKYIAESIKSVLLSTLKELELIIVDDGSTDGAVEIIKQFAEKDPRVIYVNNIKHKGVVGASNLGTRMAKGKYIARMDDDDISLPERFQKEVAFLEKHPDIMACGCWVETMPDKGKGTIWQLPTDPAEIKSMMLFCGAIANPTCLIRRSVFFDLGFWFTTYKGI